MSDPLLGLLVKSVGLGAAEILLKQIATDLTRLSVSGIIEVIEEVLAQEGVPNLTNEQKKGLEGILSSDNIWSKIFAQFQLTDWRGVMFIGPSGVGKTALMSAIELAYGPNVI
ncbi:MAG: hypothetical protein F6K42_22950, partial [Leptolyngbya sp. SIO1D8]|nr:hypothetical protein [Leptolyngbya sp. SIO1D8]